MSGPTNIALRIKSKILSSNTKPSKIWPLLTSPTTLVFPALHSGHRNFFQIDSRYCYILSPGLWMNYFPSARNIGFTFFTELTPLYSSYLSLEVWETLLLKTHSCVFPLTTSPIRTFITPYYICQVSHLTPSLKVMGK